MTDCVSHRVTSFCVRVRPLAISTTSPRLRIDPTMQLTYNKLEFNKLLYFDAIEITERGLTMSLIHTKLISSKTEKGERHV